jgi:ribosomal protein S18 acetylase RimI-like enzyme
MDDILIRKLKVEDADAIGSIQSAITQVPVTNDFKQIIRDHALRTEDASLVAEFKGRVVGFMVSYILTGGFGIDKSAWIALFGVHPKYMGQGIGQALATEIFGFYLEKGIKNIFTSVEWDSTDLLSFFKTLGFDRSNFINLRKVLK